MLSKLIRRHAPEFLRDMLAHRWERNDNGDIYFARSRLAIRGVHTHDVNGQDVRVDNNRVPAEGMIYLLGCGVGATAKLTNWYVALQGNTATPAANWTAANYAANAAEITSTTEGYTGANRPAFTAGAASVTGDYVGIDNYASVASFAMKSATSVSVYGAGVLSASARGATTGVLISAVKYAAVRTFVEDDTFNNRYRIEVENESDL